MKRKLNIACLNVRGCRQDYKRRTIIDDCKQNDLHILGLSETHVLDTELINYNKYTMYLCKGTSHHGVGIVVDQSLNPTFKQLSERICQCEIQLVDRKLVAIVAYAPTLSQSEKHPELRDDFYQQLDSAISKVANIHALVVMGDFNAKT